MNDVMKVAAAGIIAAVCAMVVRKQAPELAVVLAICAGALILLYCSGALAAVVAFMEELVEAGGLAPEVIAPVVKVTGIAIVTRLSADFCRDAQEGALAAAVETAGSALALLTVLPLMSSVLKLLKELM
ncbi:MAG: SpoIIIAC/SpoIIIAD family protein [Candidatus Enterenecus sp.]